MKTFFASLLGTLAALLLIVFGTFTVGLVLLGAMASLGSREPTVESGSYLVLDLTANITDAPAQSDGGAIFAALAGDEGVDRWQLRMVTRALDKAATDDRIAGIYVTGKLEPMSYGTSLAALDEVRRALTRFQATGKPVKAYFVYAGAAELFLASGADDLVLDPYGSLGLAGLASQPMFWTGLFDRFGIGVQAVRVGEYKSATEPFTRKDLSLENREQLQSLLDDLWGEMRDSIAAARGLEPAQVQAAVDAGDTFFAEEAMAAGLVDRLAYRDEVIAELREATGAPGEKATFTQISLAAYARAVTTDRPGSSETPAGARAGRERGRVAVVYAEGAIVDGEGGAGEVGGDRFARELRALRRDSSVRAIVLRVNSPGGSATASEHVRRELALAREEMPVVVSMGGYAASGGYWIATASDRIFVEPGTVTGSIGVFGLLLNIEKLGNDLGLTWDTVKTGEFADLGTIARPKNEAELALFQRMIDRVYVDFVARVAEVRDLPVVRVEELAGGRVWSGTRAVALGLADAEGGLADAIAYAAGEAGLGAGFRITEFPRKKELAEAISEMVTRLQPGGARASAGPVHAWWRAMQARIGELEEYNDPRHVYARWPWTVDLR